MKTTFSRQMALITALILLTLVLLGSALRLTITSYLGTEKQKTLYNNAEAVASLTRAYESAGDLEKSWDFRMSMSLASEVADSDAVVCDLDGTVLVCSCDDLSCPHLGRQADAAYLTSVIQSGASYTTGRLDGIYDDERYIQGVPLRSENSGEIIGVVIVSAPVEDGSVSGLFRIFIITAVAVLLIALAATFLLSRSEARPMRELTEIVRRFGHGETALRAPLGGGNTTEMNELSASFNNMAETLEVSERKRQEFVANVSHELKTPMTSIAGYMDGMLDGTIPPAEHPKYMKIVADEVRRLSRLVRSMLELSRMQSDGMDRAKMTRFDLGDAATRVLLTFEGKIESRRIEVDVQFPDRPVFVLAMEDAVTQVVYNLIDNAVKFCNDCGYLTLTLRTDGQKAFLTVKNTGPVIPADEIPLIFDRFHKLDKSRSRDRDGVGLGLYIVKTIVGAHGQDIWVESHDGATAFTFTMDVVK